MMGRILFFGQARKKTTGFTQILRRYHFKKIRRFTASLSSVYRLVYVNCHQNLRSVETEFPAIFFNDKLTSEEALSYEPTVSPLNDNEINFRISFEEFDDEDYTPTVSNFDDLDFFKDFENEFPAIVYNDALTSKSDSSSVLLKFLHLIDKFDLKNETIIV
ncbi:hypothetical protein Tco_0397686 [Tanacetum coccineum]